MTLEEHLTEGALDALALVEGLTASNPVNWNNILDHTNRTLLIYGLTDLAKSLLLALAAELGEDWRDTAARQRSIILSRDVA